jgi:hypothetical protein
MKALKKTKDGVIDFAADVVTKVLVEALKHYAEFPQFGPTQFPRLRTG